MKIKNVLPPLLLCAGMGLLAVFVPEKISGAYDQASMGKIEVSPAEEPSEDGMSLAGAIDMVREYGKDADVFCVTEDYYQYGGEADEGENRGVEEERESGQKRPGPQLGQGIQRELDKLEKLELLPGMNLEEMELSRFGLEQYLDGRDENRYAAIVFLEYWSGKEIIDLRYDTEQEKILTYNYQGADQAAVLPEEEEEVWIGWSDYLELDLEYIRQCFSYTAYEDEERGVYERVIQLRS